MGGSFLASMVTSTFVVNFIVHSLKLRQLDRCLCVFLVCAENLSSGTSLLDQLSIVAESPWSLVMYDPGKDAYKLVPSIWRHPSRASRCSCSCI